jgi:prevent-host-death family protein
VPTIGVRELRERTTQVLRQIRERQAEYIITYQGRPIALLLPIHSEVVEAAMAQASRTGVVGGLETWRRVAEQVRRDWPAGKSTQELMDEIRR